jgi:hypothetical protein
MKTESKKYSKTLVVRITESQYLKLLEAVVNENKKGVKSNYQPLDKSKIIREFIEKYGRKEPHVS